VKLFDVMKPVSNASYCKKIYTKLYFSSIECLETQIGLLLYLKILFLLGSRKNMFIYIYIYIYEVIF